MHLALRIAQNHICNQNLTRGAIEMLCPTKHKLLNDLQKDIKNCLFKLNKKTDKYGSLGKRTIKAYTDHQKNIEDKKEPTSLPKKVD